MWISTVAMLGLFFGTIGTTIGGLIGIFSKRNSNKFLSFVLAFASGLMLAVICFDLIPEAIEISSIYTTILGIVLGIIVMILCDNAVKSIFNKKDKASNYSFKNSKNTNLKENMVVTNEPGIYIPGKFGVRIEDTIQITKFGCVSLTNSDKNYIVI